MTVLVGYRVLKFLGLAVFAAGCTGAAFSRDCGDRSMFAYGWASAGWLLCWLAGYGMLKTLDLEMAEPFVLVSMASSMVALLAAVARAQDVGSSWMGALSMGSLAVSIASMGLRTVPAGMGFAVGIGVAVSAVTSGMLMMRGPVPPGHDLISGARRWFTWIARFEGLSLLALFGIYMPSKYLLKLELDGGQGWFGWVHGMLFMMYVLALVSLTRAAGWSLSRAALGFVASLLPFGTFAFELARRREA